MFLTVEQNVFVHLVVDNSTVLTIWHNRKNIYSSSLAIYADFVFKQWRFEFRLFIVPSLLIRYIKKKKMLSMKTTSFLMKLMFFFSFKTLFTLFSSIFLHEVSIKYHLHVFDLNKHFSNIVTNEQTIFDSFEN